MQKKPHNITSPGLFIYHPRGRAAELVDLRISCPSSSRPRSGARGSHHTKGILLTLPEIPNPASQSYAKTEDDGLNSYLMRPPIWLRKATPRPRMTFFLLLFCLLFSSTSFAHEQKALRFTTVKSNQVNARSGPGTTYPIEWVFVSKGEPVKVVAEFEQWRKVEDVEGQGGWVHSSVLSPKRSVVIMGNNIQKLMAQADAKSRIVAKLESGLRCAFDRCKDNWCKIKCDGYKGWIEMVNLWGVIKGEG